MAVDRTPDEQRAFREFYAALHAEIARRCPVIQFGQPEFCSLEDMFHFRRMFTIWYGCGPGNRGRNPSVPQPSYSDKRIVNQAGYPMERVPA